MQYGFFLFPLLFSVDEMATNLKSGKHKRYLENIPAEQVIHVFIIFYTSGLLTRPGP